ncbi:hypothetical protein JZ751_007438 [Albula glossodonta]|uniref:Uncharacterized protein n=1 Tax=Albula glossodonta TaxID=121402 RepID=A0A8T2N2E9_9TELE|nr:hypothetical protein JZ751_007438 [Albula glossodonta]
MAWDFSSTSVWRAASGSRFCPRSSSSTFLLSSSAYGSSLVLTVAKVSWPSTSVLGSLFGLVKVFPERVRYHVPKLLLGAPWADCLALSKYSQNASDITSPSRSSGSSDLRTLAWQPVGGMEMKLAYKNHKDIKQSDDLDPDNKRKPSQLDLRNTHVSGQLDPEGTDIMGILDSTAQTNQANWVLNINWILLTFL